MRLASFLAVTVACLALTACSQPAETPARISPEAPAASSPEEVDVVPVAPPPALSTPPVASVAPGAAEARSCEAEIGRAAADRLVERCRMVSPATRPPCNVANPCEMIQGEIDRSCALWERDGDAPAECKA